MVQRRDAIHVLGVCGTFMGGIALLAREMGYPVSGSDANAYPPMSVLLREQGIDVREGYHPAHLQPAPHCVVIGNALSRGNSMVEYVLNEGLTYTSGPQWLADHLLKDRWVLAVAGTHGKTTTSAMLAHILEYAGLQPGFLIGGVPLDFGVSARLGNGPFFVVEADEYDSAFFDKRSKFVHYRPRTLVLNNLEYDHADIFADLSAIKQQFHHLVRTVPSNGLIIYPPADQNLTAVLAQGCWTPVETCSGSGELTATWTLGAHLADASEFAVLCDGETQGTVCWSHIGNHNAENALSAIAAARHVGVPAPLAVTALSQFKGVKRRMELRGEVRGIRVYDDFAHHPTAIRTTLAGLRAKVGMQPIVVALELRSNTMRMGVHRKDLGPALNAADQVLLLRTPDLAWDLQEVADALGRKAAVFDHIDDLVAALVERAVPGSHILLMSNAGFGGIHQRFLHGLAETSS